MYEALIMLSEEINPSVELYRQEIQKFYSASSGEKPNLLIENGIINISFSDIDFNIVKNCSPHVANESEELSQMAKSEEREKLSESKCRFELSSSPDMDMIYFNDYLFLIQAAEKLGKVWAFSPADSEFF